MPKFRNVSSNYITGIRFASSFRDAFGDEIFSFEGDINERISPNTDSTARVFYVFENNRFIGGEPYEKLLPIVSGNTGQIITKIKAIAFDDGHIIRFE